MEKTKIDRRFRDVMYLVLCVLLLLYGAYKVQTIALAFEVWEGQSIEVRQGLAAK